MEDKKKVMLVIMDGVGFSKTGIGDAVSMAYTPTLDKLLEYPFTKLKAHGTAVGLPSDEDMGNSEVGHNALGCGQVYSQGAKLVNESIESGSIFESNTWKELINNVNDNKTSLHYIGLLSNGNVHSNISQLIAMLRKSKKEGIKQVFLHILLDGRDVPPMSALEFVNELEDEISNLNDISFKCQIASGGGRMKITMDRYEADWDMVRLGWHTHVLGEGRQFDNATIAIETYRKEFNVVDQDLPPFIIGKEGIPVGTINNNDSVILFNFRGDRALEICKAFENEDFPYFDRVRKPKVYFAGMLQYDGDLLIPEKYLVNPPNIQNTLSELLIKNGLSQYAISETQKYGHVTYFWNGNRSEKFDSTLESFFEIPSDKVSYDERPWMKSAEIVDKIEKVLAEKEYDFIRCNFPNGDMVGHTGNLAATIIAIEAVDLALSRLIKIANKNDYILIITADHGNADEMYEKNKNGDIQIRTAHSLNLVPFIIYSKDYKIIDKKFGLANVAPTIADILGIEPYESWEESMLIHN
jgi:2,3-bisphosphoglycerate-independent phosphoglycerate mutase